jgi:hypothetical protein
VNISTSYPSTGFLSGISAGYETAEDTADYQTKSTYYNIDLPIAAITTHASVANHGTLKEFDDINIGQTNYLDVNTDSLYFIQKRIALNIQSLSSNPINKNSVAINQQGLGDSIIFNTSKIKTPNIPTGTGSYRMLQDATGNWLISTEIPSVTATLDFPSTSAQNSSELTVTVSGATTSMTAIVQSKSINPANSMWSARVSSSNTVSIRFNNYSSGTIDPSSGDFVIKVFSN